MTAAKRELIVHVDLSKIKKSDLMEFAEWLALQIAEKKIEEAKEKAKNDKQ